MAVKTKIEIKDIRVDIPEAKSGEWKIEKFIVDEDGASLHNLRYAYQAGMATRTILPGEYTRLKRHNDIVMSDTPAEIRDHSYFIYKAKGRVLINGLGLGWVVEALFQKEEVISIKVIEKSLDVIKLVGRHYQDKCPDNKVLTIFHADALAYKPIKSIRYDVVWHDIWDTICADNLHDMHKLHRKYGRRTDWQGSWCRAECEWQNKCW